MAITLSKLHISILKTHKKYYNINIGDRVLAGVTETIEQFISNMGVFAPFFACSLILIESMIPILPLCTFITINFISFGTIGGFIISWFFTCLGCFLSYYLVKKGIRNWYETRMKTAPLLDNCLNYVNNLSMPSFTTLLAMPFTPAFMINIAAGMVNMNFKKFFWSILISKIFMVYFWGYVGVGIVESFSSPIIIIKISLMIVLAYLISSFVKKFIGDK
ncbi:MAG: TVP38/TMEM64 family protein [Firmicutes bacterium]|nr:TVP38/TMEM64 family protein [Bacillota bacterium]